MLQITKIQNGLNWNFEDKFFTNEYFENSYQILDNLHISIELNSMIFCLKSDETTIDEIGPFNNSQDLVDAIFKK